MPLDIRALALPAPQLVELSRGADIRLGEARDDAALAGAAVPLTEEEHARCFLRRLNRSAPARPPSGMEQLGDSAVLGSDGRTGRSEPLALELLPRGMAGGARSDG